MEHAQRAFRLQLSAGIGSTVNHLGQVAQSRHDAENGTAYIETLRAYLDALGDVVIASKRVHVHRNTLRYRLRRLCELVDLDVTDPTDRLVAELHLRLLEPNF